MNKLILTFKEFLREARSNPDKNPKIGIVTALEPYKDDADCYISFRSINKIGINPKSRYNTPNGIYAYPLKEMWHYVVNDRIPFAGEEPYVYLFKPKTKKGFVDDLYKYGSNDYDRDMEKLEKILTPYFLKKL